MKKNCFATILLLCFQIVAFSQTGITWQGTGDIAFSSFDNEHPRIVMDRYGNPMVIWGKHNTQSVFFSKWNGTAFTAPVQLNPPGLYIATASWMGPDIASHGDTLYVVVKRMPETSDTSRIFIISSFDGGLNFNAPAELAFIGDSISRFPTVTTDAAGNPIVGFMKFDSMFLDSRWAVTRSDDFGATFNTDVKASGWGGSAEVCDCCPGALVSSGDTTVMLYRNNNNNVRDIWAGISVDNSATFSSGFFVDNNNWMVMMCPSSGPNGVIINDTLYSVFMNGDFGYKTFLSKTHLASGTLSSMNMLANPAGLTIQNYPRIDSYGNAAGIVWQQAVTGSLELVVRFTNNITSGISAAYDTVALNDITNADIAVSSDKIFIVWQDDNTGTVKYRYGSYQPFNTGISENPDSEIRIYPNPFENKFTIRVPENMKAEQLIIYDSKGAVCYNKSLTGETTVDGSFMKHGIYVVKIIADSEIITRKISK